jgi:hypothetical protein
MGRRGRGIFREGPVENRRYGRLQVFKSALRALVGGGDWVKGDGHYRSGTTPKRFSKTRSAVPLGLDFFAVEFSALKRRAIVESSLWTEHEIRLRGVGLSLARFQLRLVGTLALPILGFIEH